MRAERGVLGTPGRADTFRFKGPTLFCWSLLGPQGRPLLCSAAFRCSHPEPDPLS